MILVKGVEIIPKRDKVTYATNILGKWEDYSIETYQGKVLQDAMILYKAMLKKGKSLEEEVVKLKDKLKQVNPPEDVKDFWDIPVVPEVVPTPSELDVKITTELFSAKEVDDTIQIPTSEQWDIPLDPTAPKYIIKAYTSKTTGKQMYLASWDDSMDWMISAVSYATTKDRCERLIEKATEQIEKANAESKIRSRFPKELRFEMVLVE